MQWRISIAEPAHLHWKCSMSGVRKEIDSRDSKEGIEGGHDYLLPLCQVGSRESFSLRLQSLKSQVETDVV